MSKSRNTKKKKRRQAVQQPQQDRSQATLDRLLDAAEALLGKKPFEEITVADIVRKARSSVGAFYARFADKDALLGPLYERYDDRLSKRLNTALTRKAKDSASLDDLASYTVGSLVNTYRTDRWLMRALGFHSRMRPQSISSERRARRTELHQRLGQLFLKFPEHIHHPHPEWAVEFAIYFTAATARDKILFGEAPHASATRVTDQQLTEELTRAFVAFLGAKPGS